ncbi:hypothetical protein GCM10023080_016990 [Streptomyces pseudoechinosporeus]
MRERARGAERFTLGAPFSQAMRRSAEGTRARPLQQEWGTLSPSRSDRAVVEALPGLVVPVDAVAGLAAQASGRNQIAQGHGRLEPFPEGAQDNTFVVIQPDQDDPAWFASVAVLDQGGYEIVR